LPGFVQRVGDPNAAGGIITAGVPSVLVNFRPIAVLGSPVGPHAKNPGAFCTATQFTVLANSKPVCTSATVDTSGYGRVAGSENVIIGLGKTQP
jgi:uncharacterized Zn-binding protein involved in type VI secretion